MNRYTLKAMLDDTANGSYIHADTNEDAMMQAIGYIMDRAMNSELWAKGLIELRDIEGRLVAEMGAK